MSPEPAPGLEPGQDLFSQQASNRRKSRWLMGGFVLFFAWLGLGGDLAAWLYTRGGGVPGLGAQDSPSDRGEGGGTLHYPFPFLGFAMTVGAVIMVGVARKSGHREVLASAGARPLGTPELAADRLLDNVVEEMAIASGLPKPSLYVIDDPDPNAFVTGTDPRSPHLAVTRGLLELLDRDELQGVVAHEMGHVKNLDMQLMTTVAGLVGVIALLHDGMGRMLRSRSRRGANRGISVSLGGGRRGNGKGGNPLAAVVLALWILSWLLAPLLSRLLAMAISRKREYLADAMAAQFTRNPLALASALEKIERAAAPTSAIKSGIAHLCIADPLGRRVTSRQGWLADRLATHPPMAVRVARLRAMGYRQGDGRRLPNGG